MDGVSAATSGNMLSFTQNQEGQDDGNVHSMKYVVIGEGNVPVQIGDYEPILEQAAQLKGKEVTKQIKSEKEFDTEIQRLSQTLKDDKSNDWNQRVTDL